VLDRIAQLNPRLNALPYVLADEARAAADAADRAVAAGATLGPLHGVPVTTKVNVDQKGWPTTNGLVALKDLVATEDSPPVANLRDAGAVIVGRSNVPAFSIRWYSDNDLHGRTLNPWNDGVTPGGSSGGAAAAVAGGMGPIGHGNDFGGSIRYPAYCCGIVGLRPSPGRVPAFNPSGTEERSIAPQLMSVQGPLARSVEDARLGLVALCFYDGGDRSFISRKPILRPSDLFGLRVATHPSGLEQGILRALGAKPIVLPEDKIARALKTGLIDAADADFTGFRESQKRDVGADWSATNHARSVQVVVMSRSLWGELSAHDRAALYAAAQESVAFQRKVEALLSTESPGTQAGASVDRRAFVETLRAVAESYRTAPTVEPLVNQIRETGSRDR